MIRENLGQQTNEGELRTRVLRQLAISVGLQEKLGLLERIGLQVSSAGDQAGGIVESAACLGVELRRIDQPRAPELMEFVREGQPVLIELASDRYCLLSIAQGRKVEAVRIEAETTLETFSQRQLAGELLEPAVTVYVASPDLGGQPLSSAVLSDGTTSHKATPWQRFLGLMRLEKRDIGTVVLFAFVSGLLTLATPLAVESLVNVVSWGTYVQPLLVLSCLLLVSLGLAGALRVLQTVVVEIIQRRQFVRIVGDLAHRFPRANQAYLQGKYPRELANRVFDVMTIQKATAVLLLDGVSILLTTLLGMVLLAFYHPFLLGFDIVLLLCMIMVLWLLGRGGIQTSIKESKSKYKVVHWLQDTIAMPLAFKFNGGESLAVFRSNELTALYIAARQEQFRVVLRQVAFAIALQVIASTAVLGLGGWLVITGQLTLGQLVASELVVTVVVGAFAKAGKSLEKFYDLMAGVDKVGELLDIPCDPYNAVGRLPDGPAEVRWSEPLAAALQMLPDGQSPGVAALPTSIPAGVSTAVLCDDLGVASRLARVLAGIEAPNRGAVEVAGYSAAAAAASQSVSVVAYAGVPQIFHGTVAENIDLGRAGISPQDTRDAIHRVGFGSRMGQLTDGQDTLLETGGFPLTPIEAAQLMIARAIVSRPRLVVVDGLLDALPDSQSGEILNALRAPDATWTLLLATRDRALADRCEQVIRLTGDNR